MIIDIYHVRFYARCINSTSQGEIDGSTSRSNDTARIEATANEVFGGVQQSERAL